MILSETDRLHALEMSALCTANGYTDYGMYANGVDACIANFIFTWAILADLHRGGYERRWCYESYADALAALQAWNGDGEPSGWHRDPYTGRRRPHGDASREYVAG